MLCSAKGHLLNAGICLLCSADVAKVRLALERYCDTDLNFDNSREHTFLTVRAVMPACQLAGLPACKLPGCASYIIAE